VHQDQQELQDLVEAVAVQAGLEILFKETILDLTLDHQERVLLDQ
jgi:hypothetical protein